MIEQLDRRPWPVRFRVEPALVEQFARATGASSLERVPPTFPVVMEHFGPRIVEMLESKGIDSTRMLHGEEDIEYPRGRLRVGDELSGELAITQVRRREGSRGPLTIITVAGTLRTDDGEPAVILRRTLVVVEGDVPIPAENGTAAPA